MTIVISNNYGVSFPYGRTMAYMGENELRTVQVIHPIFPTANYIMKFAYNDGVIYEVPVENGKMSVSGSLLRYEGTVQAQFYAYEIDDDGSAAKVFESEIFDVIIGKCLDGEVTAIPTYESSQDMLARILATIDNASTVTASRTTVKSSAVFGSAGVAEKEESNTIGSV